MLFLEGASDWPYLIDRAGWRRCRTPESTSSRASSTPTRTACAIGYLSERAIRICVSQEVADAISATGRANGPILTIPNGRRRDAVRAGDGRLSGGLRRAAPSGHDCWLQESRARPGAFRATGSERTGHRLLTEFLDRDTFLGLLTDEPNRRLPAPPGGGLLSAGARSHGFGLSRGDSGLHRKSRLLPPRTRIVWWPGTTPSPCSTRRRRPLRCLFRNAGACTTSPRLPPGIPWKSREPLPCGAGGRRSSLEGRRGRIGRAQLR